jgi:hypothetical protein
MLQSIAALSVQNVIDSKHFIAQMIGSVRAPVKAALPRARERRNADHSPTVWHARSFIEVSALAF